MISLIDVSRYHGPASDPHILLDRVSLRVEPLDRVGILAPSGSGKTTLARIMTGKERPDEGQVTRHGAISWPIGFAAAFHPNQTCAQNIACIARLWHLDPTDISAKVEDFVELGDAYYRPVKELSPGKRVNLGLALSLNFTADIYLADDMSASADMHYRDKCDAALADRLASSGIVVLSRHLRVIKQFATRFYVLADAQLIQCSDAQQTQEILKLIETEGPHAHAA